MTINLISTCTKCKRPYIDTLDIQTNLFIKISIVQKI